MVCGLGGMVWGLGLRVNGQWFRVCSGALGHRALKFESMVQVSGFGR
jgi:hypothetical protein